MVSLLYISLVLLVTLYSTRVGGRDQQERSLGGRLISVDTGIHAADQEERSDKEESWDKGERWEKEEWGDQEERSVSGRMMGLDTGNPAADFEAGMWIAALIGTLVSAIPVAFLSPSLGFKKRKKKRSVRGTVARREVEDMVNMLKDSVHDIIQATRDN